MSDHKVLEGVTLKALLTELFEHYGWQGLAERVDVNCFKSDPSITSSLKFLRRTPWARTKVEQLYVQFKQPNNSVWANAGVKKSKPE